MQRGIKISGTKNLQCTSTPSRRASRGDKQFKYHHTGNEDTELQAGRTDPSQCSTYQLQPSSNGTTGTDELDNERYADATQDFVIGSNKQNKDQEAVLLLDLW